MDGFLTLSFWRRAPLLALGFGVVAATAGSHSAVVAGLSIIVAPTLLPAPAVDHSAASHVVPGFGKLPIRFEPNVGQAPAPINFWHVAPLIALPSANRA
jgi:hypothetical protein